ncbi:MAG: CsbD family protein [Catenulispora sp.]|nr:CsbD family protein [Catenulispora sp.]
MNTDNKLDQKSQELKGHVEETAGKVFGDDDLVMHGKKDQIAAHAKQAATQAGETARHVGQRVKERAMQKLGLLHERLHEAADEAKRAKAEAEAKAKAEETRTAAENRAAVAENAAKGKNGGRPSV